MRDEIRRVVSHEIALFVPVMPLNCNSATFAYVLLHQAQGSHRLVFFLFRLLSCQPAITSLKFKDRNLINPDKVTHVEDRAVSHWSAEKRRIPEMCCETTIKDSEDLSLLQYGHEQGLGELKCKKK